MSPDRTNSLVAVGTVLEGAYRIDSLIGEGGMGAVYAATHLRLNKYVAVKVMARELAANADSLARFHREAEVTSALGHPHIVQVLDFSTAPSGEPFLVMEFLQGEDLERRIRRVGRLSLAQTLHVVRQVVSALAATHAKGIVHRDLKPANIFLLEAAGETDFVKVLDFGISKVSTAATRLTAAAMVMGTPSYMSPEQALGRVDEVDETTDQWALACITWECLCGAPPFEAENVPAILFQVVHEPPSQSLASLPHLPPQVEPALRRALSKSKHERFASVTAFCEALEQAVTAAAPGATVMLPAPGSRPATMLLPESAPMFPKVRTGRSASARSATTFSRASGEMSLAPVRTAHRALWLGGGAGGLLVGMLIAGFFLLRPSQKEGPSVARPSPGETASRLPDEAPLPAWHQPRPPAASLPAPAAGKPPEAREDARAEDVPDEGALKAPEPATARPNKAKDGQRTPRQLEKTKKHRPKIDRTLIEEI